MARAYVIWEGTGTEHMSPSRLRLVRDPTVEPKKGGLSKGRLSLERSRSRDALGALVWKPVTKDEADVLWEVLCGFVEATEEGNA